MTRADLYRLVDRLPEGVLDDNYGQLVLTRADLQALNDIMMELATRLGTLTIEWMVRERKGLEN